MSASPTVVPALDEGRAGFWTTLVRLGLGLVPRALAGLALWPIYWLARRWVARPPVVVSGARWRGTLRRTLDPETPIRAQARIILCLALAQRALTAPIWGLAWLLDEALYGRALDAIQVEAPIFEVSAARSGSTQLARYLEDDPRLCTPSVLMTLFPFIWLWALVPRRLGAWLGGAARINRLVLGELPEAYVQRHELDVLRTDTFEVMFYWHHLGDLLNQLGPKAILEELSTSALLETNRSLWQEDFARFLDRIGRKTLWRAGPGRRLLIKGHFLAAVPALEARYPDARFLTMIRPPASRLRSVVNFHHTQPADPFFAALPWSWVVERALVEEVRYNETERTWLSRPEANRHLILGFDDYVADLPGTLRRVYTEGLRMPPPEALPTAHAHRVRSGYAVDRSLPELGVDVAALEARLAETTRWAATAVRPR